MIGHLLPTERLIQKIYEVDPILFLKCSSEMRIIPFIEDLGVIKKTLTHLGLWVIKRKRLPVANVYMPMRTSALVRHVLKFKLLNLTF